MREDVARGRVYLPLEEMQQAGISVSDLSARRTSSQVKELLAFQAGRARQFYASALQRLPDVDRRSQLSGLVMGAIYMALLKKIEKDDFQVLERKIKLTPMRKLWIAWRTSRKESLRTTEAWA